MAIETPRLDRELGNWSQRRESTITFCSPHIVSSVSPPLLGGSQVHPRDKGPGVPIRLVRSLAEPFEVEVCGLVLPAALQGRAPMRV